MATTSSVLKSRASAAAADADAPEADAASADTAVMPAGLVGDVINGIFEPGVNASTIAVMNGSFYALFVCLATLLVLTRGNIHVGVLTALAAGLFASVQFVLREQRRHGAAAGQAAARTAAPAAATEGPSDETRSLM
ncbi:hypothetical protein CXG81DRAFT_25168 [Caulochytrium protostelioides]|uniref:Uncharacterized protein n=1 Tax=Caulochytrium protostelioides TaxID=1555241 RepID=A0A4V1IUY2_9FUNG|nr:hypothetical protein CXG81DRAFT_25168 [Caulochytrium protostelioides]|eukprot:RKP02149.1 hypothetical protein CXG81DRAFT_25168 [Caulochytrium protostelioides]